MSARFTDDVVVVTGASGLIGSACVAGFLGEGARVIAIDLEDRLVSGGALSGIPSETFDTDRMLFVGTDLAEEAQIAAAFATAEDRFGPASVLVNNAAVYGRKAYLELDEGDLMRLYRVNVFAPILCGRRAAEAMIANGIEGRIVNLSSTSSQQSDPHSVAYDSSKGAIDSATRAMAVALGRYGIRVNAVGPGEMIKSQEVDNLREPTLLSDFEKRRIPIGRVATPQEVSDAILFLSSSESRGISGTIIWVDGGTLGTWTTPTDKD
jgi:glucose 1-dehydrogenase